MKEQDSKKGALYQKAYDEPWSRRQDFKDLECMVKQGEFFWEDPAKSRLLFVPSYYSRVYWGLMQQPMLLAMKQYPWCVCGMSTEQL